MINKYISKLFPGERKRLKKHKYIKPSLWCEKNIILVKSSIAGPWRNSTVPYLAGIMDAAFNRSIRKIFICAAPQTGKSEVINCCVGYAQDRSPGDVLYLYPDELTAKENSRDRILPMFRNSAQLSKHLTGQQDDEGILRINLRHSTIYFGWANSPARTANKPLPIVVMDEVNKYPKTSGPRETGPTFLAEKRTTTFPYNRKLFYASTPTDAHGIITYYLDNQAEAIFDIWVTCPSCDRFQKMEFENIKIPDNAIDHKIIESKKLAFYLCPHCGAMWDDATRDVAVRKSEWRDRETGAELYNYLTLNKINNIGFHIPSWYSHFVSLSEVIGSWLQACPIGGKIDKIKLKDFKNNHAAEPWLEYHIEREEDRILALRDDRPRGIVPGGGIVAALTAAVDTQDNGFWYEIRYWVYYGREERKDSGSVREGFVTTFGDLAKILFGSVYRDSDGKEYAVRFALQDCLGHRTAEVYDFCRSNRGRIFPSIGRQRLAQPYQWSNQEYYPGGKKPIIGGLKTIIVNTKHFKDELSRLLEINPDDPSAFRFNSEFPNVYARHYTAEFVDDDGNWKCPAGKPNHLWDCSTLNLVAYEILGIRYWRLPGEAPIEATQQKKKITERHERIKQTRW